MSEEAPNSAPYEIDDATVLNLLDKYKAFYEQGERAALFYTLVACARFQAVIPEWAADALIDGENAIYKGEYKDFSDIFDKPEEEVRIRKREALIREHRKKVCFLLREHRQDGGTWSADDAFEYVREKTGLSRRLVEEIYNRNPQLKNIPRERKPNTYYESAEFKIPMPRRRGRKIL